LGHGYWDSDDWGFGFEVLGWGNEALGRGFRVWGMGYRDEGLRFRKGVEGPVFREQQEMRAPLLAGLRVQA